MSRTLPLSYVRPVTGTVAPGGFLTCAGGRGDVGQWVADPSAELIDPTATNTVDTLAAKHNELVWLYGLTRILTVAPRMYFGEAGTAGIQFYRDGVITGLPYKPSPVMLLPYPSITMADFLAGINATIGGDPSVAEFVYDGQRINLLLKTNNVWQICEPAGSSNNPAKYMLNVIFNRTDSDAIMNINLTGPKIIQGTPLIGPVAGT